MSLQHSMLKPYRAAIVASAARTASGTSSTLNLPQAAAYHFICDVTAISGTGALVDVAIQTSPDDGTTFYNELNFQQFSLDSGIGTANIFVSQSGGGAQIAESWMSAGTGGPIVKPCILTPKYRISWTIGPTGGSPSATFRVWLVATAKGSRSF